MLEDVVGLSGGEHGGLLSYHAVQTSAELTTVSHGVSGSLLLLLLLCHTFSFTSSETKSQQPWRPRVLVLKGMHHHIPGQTLVQIWCTSSQQVIPSACVLGISRSLLTYPLLPRVSGMWLETSFAAASPAWCVENSLL